MSERFPFPSFPRGWFVIAFSHELAPGAVKTVHYFDQDIVLFRTQSGRVSAVDKTCPHLGAHVGGGRVEGECLRCPFHGWGFDAHGKCIDVPYAPKVPPKAALRTWPLREQNGALFVYYDPEGAGPAWDLPVLDEAGWTPNQTIRWEIASHPQEIAENTVDSAHLLPVHDVRDTKIVALEQIDHTMRVVLRFVASGAVIQMPDEINEVELDVRLNGIGQMISNTHVITAGLRTRQRIHPTPINRERVAIFAIGNTQVMPDPQYTQEIDQIFWDAFVADFQKDFPNWEHKAYLAQPMLAAGDGPIIKYRRWAKQFYAAPQARAAEALTPPVTMLRARGVLSELLDRAKTGLAVLRSSQDASPANENDTHQAPLPSRDIARVVPTPQAHFASVDAYFDELPRRFDARAAGDLVAVYQWVLTGAQPRASYAEIAGGTIRVSDGMHTAPTVTIEMSTDDYLRMINGDLNGALAFSTGRGKLRGPVRLAMKMKSLFPLERIVS